jgi:hypothetical protein
LHLHISVNDVEEKGSVGITLLTAVIQVLPEKVLLGAIHPGADAPGSMVMRRDSLPWKLGQCEDIKGMVGLFMEEMHPKPLHRLIGVTARLQPLLGEGKHRARGWTRAMITPSAIHETRSSNAFCVSSGAL